MNVLVRITNHLLATLDKISTFIINLAVQMNQHLKIT